VTNEENQQEVETFREAYKTFSRESASPSHEEEVLVIRNYPEDPGDDEMDQQEEEIAALVLAAQAEREKVLNQSPISQQTIPIGYVTNARNATSRSDLFLFWAPAEETSLGIGSIVRHTATISQPVDTYGIIIDTIGNTLGLDDYAIHVYEQDAQPPLDSILPAPSARRPIVHYQAKVLASTQKAQRPVLSGPVYAVTAAELSAVHRKAQNAWLDPQYLLLGFYEDASGAYGLFGEERARVLGPKQGHVIFSGLPGAGKTSLFLTLGISLYAQLHAMEKAIAQQDRSVPGVATVAINIKGADLLFLDHVDAGALEEHDLTMWRAAEVNIQERPFGRVIVYTPLKEDGFNRSSLRSNPGADIPGYSETREFALGIQEIWPYLGLFFEKTSTGATALIAEAELYLKETQKEGFTLADVLNLFNKAINKPKSERKGTPWEDFHPSTIQAVMQRFRSLPATLKGLIDVTGKGIGLSTLAELKPYDMVVIDIERIMANPSDPVIAESTIKIITAYVLHQLTEAMTQGTCNVDHIIVFADELNRLAPRDGNGGIGEYLAQLARTTRDRGIVLFGAGQFRSGINEDILKAASVHYSMRTPEHELSDRIYAPLSPEFKARLTQLEPGQTVLQYPSLRTAVFASFPRPFVMSGALAWQKHFPPIEDRPIEECIYERLARLDPPHPPLISEVKRSLDGLMQRQEEREKQHVQKDLINILRNIEVLFVSSGAPRGATPWQIFLQDITAHYPVGATAIDIAMTPTPSNFEEGTNEEWE
jgi:hypothetical protein